MVENMLSSIIVTLDVVTASSDLAVERENYKSHVG